MRHTAHRLSYLPPAETVVEPWGPVLPVAAHLRCRVVRQVTAEMVMLVGERVPLRRDRRRTSCHVRQISMYVCHVVLQISLTDIGYSFGRDRTTVSHACNVVEDRRDDPAFDDFVASLERVVTSVFGTPGGRTHA
ncbi:transposase [Rhizobium sp. RCAM05350]|nr:transposase [Rhizobium sp. RCAM05350]